MRLLHPLILSLTALSSCVFAQDAGANTHKVKHDYQVGHTLCLFCISVPQQIIVSQSDVARLRKIVVNRCSNLTSESTSSANYALRIAVFTRIGDIAISKHAYTFSLLSALISETFSCGNSSQTPMMHSKSFGLPRSQRRACGMAYPL